jgi:ribose-phosphate pyrophosphokinase
MIKYNGKPLEINYFPDGTLRLDIAPYLISRKHIIEWKFENNEEMATLYFLVNHIRSKDQNPIQLIMPYIPNARMDRQMQNTNVYTLKYFCNFINSLSFERVYVLDPHSYVSTALLNNVEQTDVLPYIYKAYDDIQSGNILLFYPDEGAAKRYAKLVAKPYAVGIKKRDEFTGQIIDYKVNSFDDITGKDVLIIDDICSYGGTFYHAAKALKELGVNNIYLYVSHCENNILKGKIFEDDLIKKVYTTDSIFTENSEKVKVYKIGY